MVEFNVEKRIGTELEELNDRRIKFVVEKFYGHSPTDDRITDSEYKRLYEHVNGILVEAREFDIEEYGKKVKECARSWAKEVLNGSGQPTVASADRCDAGA